MDQKKDMYNNQFRYISIFLIISCFLTFVFAEHNSINNRGAVAKVATKDTQTKQISTESQAFTDARIDAQAEVDNFTWFLIGCIGGLMGWILASTIEPNPPASRLLGKSPKYIATYTDTYRDEVKSRRGNNALTGCIVGNVVPIIVYVGLVLVSVSASSSNGY